MTVAIEWNDSEGDILDREYACGDFCANDYLVREGITDMTNPQFDEANEAIEVIKVFGIDTDYEVFCAGCGVLLTLGLESERPDCTMLCLPVVVGRIDHPTEEYCEHEELTKVSIPWSEAEQEEINDA